MYNWSAFMHFALPHFDAAYHMQAAIVGSRVYGNTLATLCAHYPTGCTVERSVVGTRAMAVL